MEEKKIKILQSLCIFMMILTISSSFFDFLVVALTFYGLHAKNAPFLKIMLIPLFLETIIYTIYFVSFLTEITIYFVSGNNQAEYKMNFSLLIIIKTVLQFLFQLILTSGLYSLLKNPIALLEINNSSAEVIYTSNIGLERENSLPSYSPPNPLPPYSPPATNINSLYVQSPNDQINGDNTIIPYQSPIVTPYPPPNDDASIIITPTRIEPYPPMTINSNNNNNNNNILPDQSISIINPNSTYITNIPNLTNLEVPSTTEVNMTTPITMPVPNGNNNSYVDMLSDSQFSSTTNLLGNTHRNVSSTDITAIRIHIDENSNLQDENINSNNSETTEPEPTHPPPPYTLYPNNNNNNNINNNVNNNDVNNNEINNDNNNNNNNVNNNNNNNNSNNDVNNNDVNNSNNNNNDNNNNDNNDDDSDINNDNSNNDNNNNINVNNNDNNVNNNINNDNNNNDNTVNNDVNSNNNNNNNDNNNNNSNSNNNS